MPRLLTDDQIGERLHKLNGWERRRRAIRKKYTFETFMDGIAFVDKVAATAEKMEHHPDIKVVWTTVTLSIQTHSEGGLTSWDFQLAKAIDEIAQ